MKLFKVKLGDSPFWFLNNIINLTMNDTVSGLLDIESLSFEEIETINKSASRIEIKIFDSENNRVKNLNELGYFNGNFSVNTEDVKEDESSLMPEVFSVTIDNDEDEEDELEEDNTPSESDIENAKIFLSKNGNTIKKTIKQMKASNEQLVFLHACLMIEEEKLNRSGVIQTIQNKIAEF